MSLPPWIAAGARIEAEGPFAASWSAAELGERIGEYAAALAHLPRPATAGLAADNSPHWLAVDLAAQAARINLVPLPAFFTPEQMTHAVRASNMRAVFATDAAHASALGFTEELASAGPLRLFRSTVSDSPALPLGTEGHKITFTSGTTQAPKGVVLSSEQQLRTARSLAVVMGELDMRRHLCALPLPVLLENVAGAYTALALGATCICPTLADVGMSGASGFDAERLLHAIAYYEAHSVILLPQMLQAIVARLAVRPKPDRRIRSLVMASVGGAKTPATLIVAARQLGIPVYEGYGLTECGSVVSLNLPGADRAGTVGKALPGVTVRATADGELEVSGRPYVGYLDSIGGKPQTWFATGDLGTVDADGFIAITGRKKNVLVTSFGRNISPEWPESLLLENPHIAQAGVFGDARPYLVAIIVASTNQIEDAALEEAVQQANLHLPDYARIRSWVRATEPFTARNGLATANGRIRRDAVSELYADRLSALYDASTLPSAGKGATGGVFIKTSS
jgi:long-subunit acyl-CoA synthetase (AMP-forming)